MRSIKDCLNKELIDLCQRSRQLEQLNKVLAALLPEDLAQNCHAGSFNKGCLLITTNDAVWASQLRYLIPELRDKLRSEAKLYQLTSIKIKVMLAQEEYKKVKKQQGPVLSDKAKADIISESAHCSYLPLKKALIRLAE